MSLFCDVKACVSCAQLVFADSLISSITLQRGQKLFHTEYQTHVKLCLPKNLTFEKTVLEPPPLNALQLKTSSSAEDLVVLTSRVLLVPL